MLPNLLSRIFLPYLAIFYILHPISPITHSIRPAPKLPLCAIRHIFARRHHARRHHARRHHARRHHALRRISLRGQKHHDLTTHVRRRHVPAHQRLQYVPQDAEPQGIDVTVERRTVNQAGVDMRETDLLGVFVCESLKYECFHKVCVPAYGVDVVAFGWRSANG
jgi:hypothetical protein